MAQFVVRNLENDVHAKLKARARLHGQSVEEEVRTILRAAVTQQEDLPLSLGTWCMQQFGGDESVDPVDFQEWRGSESQPAIFDPQS